ncbi:MAG: FAD-dependent thymidylate synthase [Ignavibacteriae bacterium]|jgi:thymidylate synthase (FAD)|nr:FAD-dependent thymidylate synthase [Ignavibacteriota bacterium]
MEERLIRNVLDKGFIEVIDHLGNDLTVANSARVSFGKRKSEYDERDRVLVKFLAENKHWSPFRHLVVQFHVKAPEFVMRQWYKHVVGIETTSNSSTKDHAWNEISGRYVPVADFYRPSNWRRQSDDNKQASEGSIENQDAASKLFDESMSALIDTYEKLMELGVAKEQARIMLPLNQYTEVYWTASFQAIMNYIELRDEPTAQWEIRQYAIAMKELVVTLYPETVNIWLEVLEGKK